MVYEVTFLSRTYVNATKSRWERYKDDPVLTSSSSSSSAIAALSPATQHINRWRWFSTSEKLLIPRYQCLRCSSAEAASSAVLPPPPLQWLLKSCRLEPDLWVLEYSGHASCIPPSPCAHHGLGHSKKILEDWPDPMFWILWALEENGKVFSFNFVNLINIDIWSQSPIIALFLGFAQYLKLAHFRDFAIESQILNTPQILSCR